MNILVLNASPKGKNSTTVHTALYLQALHPEHHFTFAEVASGSKVMKRILPRFAPSCSRRIFCFSPIRSTPSSPPTSCTGSSS